MVTEIDSNKAVESYNKIWRLLGLRFQNPTLLTRVYYLFLTIVVTFFYPLHFVIGLLIFRDPRLIFGNLIMNIASVMTSVKHFLYFPQFKRMDEISRLLKELDRHVLTKEDCEFHQKNIRLISERLLKLHLISYHLVISLSVAMWAMREQPALMYQGWFPFDWRASSWANSIAVIYQIFAIEVEALQNVVHDSYVPMALCFLSGHTQLLGKRLARIGYDENKTEKEHYDDLVECAKDYQLLWRFFFQLQETISWPMLLQSVSIGANFCVAVIYMVFYAEEIFEYGFAISMVVGVSIQFYPGCYYGSSVEKTFYDLTYAAFSCNWQDRSLAFKRSLKIFTEFTLRPATMFAKSVVKIHLDTYFATMRFSYSLFCVILRLK